MEIPEALAAEVESADNQHAADIGIEWATRQAAELLSAGVPYLHFYIMSTSRHVSRVVKDLRKMA